jgi:hypothetical protein
MEPHLYVDSNGFLLRGCVLDRTGFGSHSLFKRLHLIPGCLVVYLLEIDDKYIPLTSINEQLNDNTFGLRTSTVCTGTTRLKTLRRYASLN